MIFKIILRCFLNMNCLVCKKIVHENEQTYCSKCECNFHTKCTETFRTSSLECLGCRQKNIQKKKNIQMCESTSDNFTIQVENQIHEEWKPVILQNLSKVTKDIETYYSRGVCFPPKEKIFTWAETPLSEVKVVILGQDPYIKLNEAHGLSFSVPDDIKVPPSLRNIYAGITEDLGEEVEFPKNGNLLGWRNQGVLLLNCSLTVKEGKSNSHSSTWARFTKNIVKHVASTQNNVVFMLWGNFAQSKEATILPYVEEHGHLIIKEGHPSPLNTSHKFVGTKCFSECNEFLVNSGDEPVVWTKHLP